MNDILPNESSNFKESRLVDILALTIGDSFCVYGISLGRVGLSRATDVTDWSDKLKFAAKPMNTNFTRQIMVYELGR